MSWLLGLFCIGSVLFFAWSICRAAAEGDEHFVVCRACGSVVRDTETVWAGSHEGREVPYCSHGCALNGERGTI
jgi:hypothetical protein